MFTVVIYVLIIYASFNLSWIRNKICRFRIYGYLIRTYNSMKAITATVSD
jgi:hypothetical protein